MTTTAVKKRGRPTLYTEAIADEICERLAAGESVVAICSSPGMPSDSAVEAWAEVDHPDRPGFCGRYARARERGLQRLAEEALAIADAPCLFEGRPDPALVQQARLQVDTRKWYLSKLLPRQFGDKVVQEVTGADGAPLVEGPSDPSKVALVLLNILNRARPGDDEEPAPVVIEGRTEGE